MSSQTATSPTPRVFLAGAGRVGTAVAMLLRRADFTITGVASRSEPSARRAAELLATESFHLVDGELPASDIWLIGANDDGIASVAAALAERVEGGIAVHLSGSLGTSVLQPLRDAGLGIAALHPVQACPDILTALERLPGSTWGVTVSPGLEGWADALVTGSLGGSPRRVPEEDRAVWHAASVLTSNGIAALLAFGESCLDAIGQEAPEEILGPLAAGTVANARAGGGGGATLTGPVVRGEVATIARHLDALDSLDPALGASYGQVGNLILDAARRAGRLSAATAKELEEVFRPWK